MFWLPIVAAAAAAAGTGIGAAVKKRRLDRREEYLNSRAQENENWYNRRYNEDATQRADSIRMLTLTEDAIKRRNRAAAGRAAVMGGTEESVAAEKERNNELMADAAGQIAVAAERRKDAIEQQYMNRKEGLDAALYDTESKRDSGLDVAGNIVGGIGSALGSFAGIGLYGEDSGKTTPAGETTAAKVGNPSQYTVRKERR